MGIGQPIVEMLIRERTYRPLDGDVVMIGRQTVGMTAEHLLSVFHGMGEDIGGITPADIEVERTTTHAKQVGRAFPTDRALLKLVGARSVKALDHSDFEGAEIIHDLNQPLPAHLHETADLVIDGSTIDNVFNPALALKAFADLLRPGGRLISHNQFSNYASPYVMVSPLWAFDYFVVNGFVDCKVYITVITNEITHDGQNIFTFDLDYLLNPDLSLGQFESPHIMTITVFAEKGPHSTTDRFPSQQHYRSEAEWTDYRCNLATIAACPRHHLMRSPHPIKFHGAPSGYLFMGADFTARESRTLLSLVSQLRKKAGRLAHFIHVLGLFGTVRLIRSRYRI